MKKYIIFTLSAILLQLVSFGVTQAQVNKITQQDNSTSTFSTLDKVTISGFGDFLTTINRDNTHQIFEIGQAEIGFEYPVTLNTNISLAIAYNEDAFEIGSFYYEHLYQKDNSPYMLSLTLGQFDVPFGIDWHVYPSIDRNLITSPLIISKTHDGWNDLGVNLKIDSRYITTSIYAINGFSHDCFDRNNNQILTNNNFALGSKFDIKLKNLIIGGSFAYVDDKNDMNNMYLIGADASWSSNNLFLKAEYIQHRIEIIDLKDIHDDGYYFQSKYNFQKFYVVSRISSHKHIAEKYSYKYSNGFGISIQENIIARSEWLHDTENDSNEFILQLAIGY